MLYRVYEIKRTGEVPHSHRFYLSHSPLVRENSSLRREEYANTELYADREKNRRVDE